MWFAKMGRAMARWIRVLRRGRVIRGVGPKLAKIALATKKAGPHILRWTGKLINGAASVWMLWEMLGWAFGSKDGAVPDPDKKTTDPRRDDVLRAGGISPDASIDSLTEDQLDWLVTAFASSVGSPGMADEIREFVESVDQDVDVAELGSLVGEEADTQRFEMAGRISEQLGIEFSEVLQLAEDLYDIGSSDDLTREHMRRKAAAIRR
jgi:hypothetical protein